MNPYRQRTWAEVSLDALSHNLAAIREHLPPKTKVMAVVKADGYGHGDGMTARTLAEAGVDYFAVSNLEEALSLREAGIDTNILILGYTAPQAAPRLATHRITQAVFSHTYALELADCCKEAGVVVDIHLKLDTGMGRIGFSMGSEEQLRQICALPEFRVTGIFSHLSSADGDTPEDAAYTKLQCLRFADTVAALEREGFSFPLKHLQNSAGLAFLPDLGYDYARAGIVLYGAAPGEAALPFPLEPVLSLRTTVSMVKEVPAGTAVSYGRHFVTHRPMRLATVPIGYADGYPRRLSHGGWMLVGGRPAPIVGSICMDQLMLDVTGIPGVEVGDTVTVIGRDGAEEITVNQLAATADTIGYEILCMISKRVPRIYSRAGVEFAVKLPSGQVKLF